MGCFDMSCLISRLPVHAGDKCCILPTIKNQYHESGPWANYKMALPPIFGVYNDYGSMEKIVRDYNTELIEKYFELPIEKVVKACCGRKDPYGSYSDVHAIYGDISKFAGYTTDDKTLNKFGFIIQDDVISHPYLTDTNTKLLGTTHNDETGSVITLRIVANDNILVEKGGVTVYTHRRNESVSRLLIELNKNVKNYFTDVPYIYGMDEKFHKRAFILCKITPVFVNSEVFKTSIKMVKFADYETEHINKDIAKFKNSVEAYNNAKASFDQISAGDHAFELNCGIRYVAHSFTELPLLRDIRKHIFIENFSDNTIKLINTLDRLNTIMYDNNALVTETNSMHQHGDIRTQVRYMKKFIKIGEKTLKNRGY